MAGVSVQQEVLVLRNEPLSQLISLSSTTQIPAEPGVKENAVGPKEGWRGLEDVQLTFASRVGKQCGVFIFH